jgi:hypothetical protein
MIHFLRTVVLEIPGVNKVDTHPPRKKADLDISEVALKLIIHQLNFIQINFHINGLP